MEEPNILKIINYDKFKCMGADCPHTCCKGWIIAVDAGTAEVIKQEKGWKGLALRLSTHYENNGTLAIRKIFNRCPFYGRDGLCGHEKEGRLDLMPRICRMYPRRVVAFNSISITGRLSDFPEEERPKRVEVTFELSCYSAAKWFLDNLSKPELVSFYGEHNCDESDNIKFPLEILWTKKNDSDSFLDFLIRYRERLIEEIWASDEIFSVMNEKYKQLQKIQGELLRHSQYGEVDVEKLLDVGNEGLAQDKAGASNLLIPFTIINRIIYQCFDENNQKKKNPVFSRMLRDYNNFFGKESPASAERKLLDFVKGDKYKAYFSYCLMEEIPEAYEDYHLLGKYLFSALFAESLMIFDMANHYGAKFPEAEVLSSFERAFRHSMELRKNILSVLRQDMLATKPPSK